MIEVSKCVVCDGEIRQLRPALVAPFLARRIWGRPPFCVDLVGCKTCGFRFYNPRLDASEECRLYSGYRSDEYQRMRQASEPWYTVSFNAGLASPTFYEDRRRMLRATLSKHVQMREIKRVLDYGGGRGDLVCGLIDGATAFVYDISGMPAADGVTPTTDPRACNSDLIINSNVLEHVGFPQTLMREILEATPPGKLVFLEVPCESPFGLARIAKRVAQIGIMTLTQPTLARSVVRPSSLYMMHEHINYYTEPSLAALMRCCGLSVLNAGSYDLRGRAAWCLGTAEK